MSISSKLFGEKNNLIVMMGSDKLWWPWVMASQRSEPTTSHSTHINYGLWNDANDQERSNTSGLNTTWFATGNSTTSTTITIDHDIIITIVIATVLGLVILITFCVYFLLIVWLARNFSD